MKPTVVIATLALLVALSGCAREPDSISIPDTLTLKDEKLPLVLNGSGHYKTLLTKVYIGSMYLTHPAKSAERVMNMTTTRVMRLHYLRDVNAAKQAAAWRDGFVANHSTFDIQGLSKRIRQFTGMLPDIKANEVMRLDLQPRGTTQVWINDTLRGSVDGADFQNALLKTWLGPKPVDKDLKQALLGGKK